MRQTLWHWSSCLIPPPTASWRPPAFSLPLSLHYILLKESESIGKEQVSRTPDPCSSLTLQSDSTEMQTSQEKKTCLKFQKAHVMLLARVWNHILLIESVGQKTENSLPQLPMCCYEFLDCSGWLLGDLLLAQIKRFPYKFLQYNTKCK